MKTIFLAFIVLLHISCVSTKKYALMEERCNNLQNQLETKQYLLSVSKDDLISSMSKVDSLTSLLYQQSLRISKMESNYQFQSEKLERCKADYLVMEQENQKLVLQSETMVQISKINADIMKKTMEDLNTQQLKVLNLSLALQRYDSLQISAVKKPKKQLSEEKLKRSLEKVGFVFY